MTRPLLAFGAGVAMGSATVAGAVYGLVKLVNALDALHADERRKLAEQTEGGRDVLRGAHRDLTGLIEQTEGVRLRLDELRNNIKKNDERIAELHERLAADRARASVFGHGIADAFARASEDVQQRGKRSGTFDGNLGIHDPSSTSMDDTSKVGHTGVVVAAAVSDPGGSAASDLSHAGPSRGCAEGCCDE